MAVAVVAIWIVAAVAAGTVVDPTIIAEVMDMVRQQLVVMVMLVAMVAMVAAALLLMEVVLPTVEVLRTEAAPLVDTVTLTCVDLQPQLALEDTQRTVLVHRLLRLGMNTAVVLAVEMPPRTEARKPRLVSVRVHTGMAAQLEAQIDTVRTKYLL